MDAKVGEDVMVKCILREGVVPYFFCSVHYKLNSDVYVHDIILKMCWEKAVIQHF